MHPDGFWSSRPKLMFQLWWWGGRQFYPTQILDATRLLRSLIQCVFDLVIVASADHPTQILWIHIALNNNAMTKQFHCCPFTNLEKRKSTHWNLCNTKSSFQMENIAWWWWYDSQTTKRVYLHCVWSNR